MQGSKRGQEVSATGVDHKHFFDNALLSSSRLAVNGEGMLLTCSTTGVDESHPLYMGTWDVKAHFYEYYLRYNDINSYFYHARIRMSDNKLPIWTNPAYKGGTYFTDLWAVWDKDLTDEALKAKQKTAKESEHVTDPPTKYRPCIAY